MSYTRPAYNAADASWEGESTYTRQAYDAADASFAPSQPTVDITLPGLIGAPRVIAISASQCSIRGTGLIGAPTLIGESPPVALVTGAGTLGSPALRLRHGMTARLWATGPLGEQVAQACVGYRARLNITGPLGAPSVMGYLLSAQLRAVGALGAPQALIKQHPVLAPPNRVGFYKFSCLLTGAADGLADVTLPISSFQVRHRADTDSYYSVVIPTYAVIGDIAARPHGEIVLSSTIDSYQEELMRGPVGDVQSARGPNSQSITISGNASQPAHTAATYPVDQVSYIYTTFDGEARWRIAPRAAIRPGDTLRYRSEFVTVGTVTWSMAATAGEIAGQMEVATA